MEQSQQQRSASRVAILNAVIARALNDTPRWLQPGPGQLDPGLAAAVGMISAAKAVGDSIDLLGPDVRAEAEALVLELLRSGLREAEPFLGDGLDESEKEDALKMAGAIERLVGEAEAVGIGPYPQVADAGYQLREIVYDLDPWLMWCPMIEGTVAEWVLERSGRTLRARCARSLIPKGKPAGVN